MCVVLEEKASVMVKQAQEARNAPLIALVLQLHVCQNVADIYCLSSLSYQIQKFCVTITHKSYTHKAGFKIK